MQSRRPLRTRPSPRCRRSAARTTAADEVEERLIIAIARGDKASGERVTEAEIASALEVSRVPAREAMQKLQLRGILVAGEKRGLRVSDYMRAASPICSNCASPSRRSSSSTSCATVMTDGPSR